MNKPIISFIIPAYNAENVLERAVQSILAEKASDEIEILIIENGSTDSTAEIAALLGKKYDVVNVFHSNKGVSSARNVGINMASGKWISFVDADDLLTKGALVTLCADAVQENSDLYIYNYEKGDKKVFVHDSVKRDIYQKADLVAKRAEMISNPTKCMAVWGKLFRRELLEKHSIRFNEKLRLSEDSDFLIRYTQHCNYISFCHEVVYHYSLETTSTVRVYDGSKAADYVTALKETRKVLENENVQIKKAYQKYILMHLNIILVHEVFCLENRSRFSEKQKQMKHIQSLDIFKSVITSTRFSECFSLRMLPILMLKCHLPLISGVIYFLRAVQNKAQET